MELAPLDHIVYAGPDVDRLAEDLAERTGIAPAPGGRHVGKGTRNYLMGLGGRAYLEIIGPDTPADRDTPRFGIDRLTGPRVVTWVVEPPDLDATVARARAAGYDPGDVGPLSRRTPDGVLLEWRLTPNPPPTLDGLAPALIDWLEAPHPTSGGPPTVELVSLRGFHPDPGTVARALDALGVRLEVRAGAPGFEAELQTPNGRITLR